MLLTGSSSKVDALTPHPAASYGAPSEGMGTPPSATGGIPIPHVRSMSAGTFQNAFVSSAGSPTTTSFAHSSGAVPMARTESNGSNNREKEKALYPRRVIISSMC